MIKCSPPYFQRSALSASGGKILYEEAYAQGKMLDHSSWKLPRGCTPSDVDMYFDNDGRLILAELSSKYTRWTDLDVGQWRGYRALIHSTEHVAILLKHAVPKSRKINTRNDIQHYQLMMWRDGFYTSNVYSGSSWPQFVELWFEKPDQAIRRVTNAAEHSISEWLEDCA